MMITFVRLAGATAITLSALGATLALSLAAGNLTPAFAQASTVSVANPSGGGTTGGGGNFARNEESLVPGRMPCGVGATSVYCKPPRRHPLPKTETVAEECSCDRVYRDIGGRLMIVTECYSVHDADISLPTDQCKPQRKIY